MLIVDEAARVDDELYFAVRPMLAVSGGALMMLTTPHGKRGVFFEEWTGGAGWERYEVPAEECPRITHKFLEEEREALPSWVYRQEYECSFEETEDTVFTHEMVERAVTSEVTARSLRVGDSYALLRWFGLGAGRRLHRTCRGTERGGGEPGRG